MGKLRDKFLIPCPYCNLVGFSNTSLKRHINKSHIGKEIPTTVTRAFELMNGGSK